MCCFVHPLAAGMVADYPPLSAPLRCLCRTQVRIQLLPPLLCAFNVAFSRLQQLLRGLSILRLPALIVIAAHTLPELFPLSLSPAVVSSLIVRAPRASRKTMLLGHSAFAQTQG